MSEQKADPFDTPPREQIRPITEGHVAAMESSSGEPIEIWKMFNMYHLLLRMIGRKSGEQKKVALPYWLDADNNPIVVASYAGAEKHPVWFLNLEDKKANPEVQIKTFEDEYWAEVEILDDAEHAKIWGPLTEDRPCYAEYQTMTERRIPLVRFIKKRAI